MKVILSRKGFDSSSGGWPSPILPDGRLVSFPIPSDGDSIRYNDLRLDRNKTYFDLMNELGIMEIKGEQNRYDVLNSDTECHFDPDISRDALKRHTEWKGAFGQIGGAQTHLRDTGCVGIGDLFLFFGWFRETRLENGELRWIPDTDKHVIFGYLQIGKIIDMDEREKVPEWLKYHPHAMLERRKLGNNTVYVSDDNLTWNKRLFGAGPFSYGKELILTKDGLSRSKWKLPAFFKHAKMSCHSEKSWKENYFQSVGRGQEFVITDNSKVEQWAKGLVNKYAILSRK